MLKLLEWCMVKSDIVEFCVCVLLLLRKYGKLFVWEYLVMMFIILGMLSEKLFRRNFDYMKCDGCYLKCCLCFFVEDEKNIILGNGIYLM